jgi:hypothetical protein
VQFSIVTRKTGSLLYTIEAQPQREERVLDNNHVTVPLDVTDEQLKILYVEYGPRWDFRFLDHSLRRDHGIEPTLVMQAQFEGDGVAPDQLPIAAKLPRTVEEFARFDLVILGDISPAMLPVKLQEELLTAIRERGVGLIIQPGTQHMPDDFLGQPLAHAMPVTFEAIGPTQSHGRFAPRLSPFSMQVSAEGAAHPAFQLHDDATRNRRFWGGLAPFYWAASADEAKPGATVLAKAVGPGVDKPLIAEQYFGRGRVMMIGTDCTFLWRRNVGDKFFYRFWGQAIRHIARNQHHNPDRSWLDATPTRTTPGESVAIELYSVDSSGKPSDAATQSVVIASDAGSENLTLNAGSRPGVYNASWRPQQAGRYEVRLHDAAGKTTTTAIDVQLPTREFADVGVDRDSLRVLAEASGGRLLELDQIDQLPALIKPLHITVPFSHDEELWDNWPTLVLLISLYCTDIGIRRFKGVT